MPTINEALAYTRQVGCKPPWAVFPLKAGTKKPAIPRNRGGRGYLDATLDEETIREWWRQYPRSNIGVPTGEINGFLCIDVDDKPYEGKFGSESLKMLEEQYGKLPDTPEQITPSGGRHLLFKYPAGVDIRDSEGKLDGSEGIAPAIDIRANGGYIVVAPSELDGGARYTFEASSLPSETELAELPQPWIDLLVEKSGGKKDKQKSKRFQLPDTVCKGCRNSTMFRYAASMRARGVDEKTMLDHMRTENRKRFLPPLDDNEIQTIYASVLEYPAGNPKRERKPTLTLDALEEWLDKNGIEVRRNLLSHNITITGMSEAYNRETLNNDLHVILHDALKHEFFCDRSLVADLLGVVAGKHRFNPVLDMLADAPAWDGVDRVQEIYNILRIPDDDDLSRVLLHKWLIQTRSIVENEIDTAFGADGVLVLQGAQGIGKTTFARTMAIKPEFVKLGQYVDSKDKDTTRRVTSCWIAELGEIETTLRSDLERLKAFITAEVDEYRLPYGRSDISLARRTSLIATCNTERFLIDPTGSRRFWTVPVAEIDLDALNKLDVIQLWKQIELEVAADPQSFRLTKSEQMELATRNSVHEKLLKSQAEVEDILQDAEQNGGYAWEYMTVSQFKCEYNSLTHYTVEQVSKALDKLGIEMEKRRIDGKPSRVRKLPRHRWGCDERYA